jgi:hypothetical protein
MNQAATIYSLDSSALIAAWTDTYVISEFATFWDRLGALGDGGRAIVTEEVYEEIAKKDDKLYEWLGAHPRMIASHGDDVQRSVSEILRTHPLLIKALGVNRSGADPFVIALARCRRATVISQEQPGSATKPKIPDVCAHYSVPCERLRHLIANEEWRF